ncbi:Carboxypeptidase regulatory-like domain-containing protein [Geoalkalibacter ferrihydriticus]|uniref:Carboxypeptidase regulatory-like domain-containing protein n=2 Tax=Geoalkalibacter ferrihydriticus TaxID=392333 RepID=A0A0C2HLD3_9BACT|nr:carboxypeptidase-like regulatory domain-containing protein [Geoalkalibacter ferrihydriticus]KIH77886.1 hypothetical protein GFER_04510 [Geoalkalibacter ferrihydriticus DSM 17813]SDM95486.1 Carboxypeptidase regulatory-like domain-containing protein [Geoalkalibacter ferrihydriticus]
MSRLLILMVLLFVLPLGGCSETSTPAGEDGLTRIEGQVVAPLEGAYLYVYRQGMDLHGPAFAVSRATAEDGRFELSLPEGDYMAVVRKRQNGETSGPVVAGDYRSEMMPLKVRGGHLSLNVEAPVKSGDERLLTQDQILARTGLSGAVLDSEGRPVEGARVHVYDHVQMSERPKYVSEKTGPDGRYLIHLPEGGTYYLAARDKFGGPPQLGDLYGRYDQGTIEPSAVVLEDGRLLENIDIRVTKVW